jgi:uncharacterized protein YdeI (YjbR/CyaY-like superfamily)
MEIGETLYVTEREDWRAWLEEHFEDRDEIWLVMPKKASAKPAIEYNAAVEEALCFGWIDSTRKALDEDSSAQRFSPRRPGSGYSQPNKERLAWLAARGRIHASMQAAAEAVLAEAFDFPDDIIAAIRANPDAWVHYQDFPAGYQRIRIAYIDGARQRPEEFEKRLNNFIEKSAQGQMIRGYGGIDKYYSREGS